MGFVYNKDHSVIEGIGRQIINVVYKAALEEMGRG